MICNMLFACLKPTGGFEASVVLLGKGSSSRVWWADSMGWGGQGGPFPSPAVLFEC